MGQRPEHPTDRAATQPPVSKGDLLARAAELAATYVADEREHRVVPTADQVDELRAVIDAIDLDRPTPAAEVLELVGRVGDEGAVRSTGGRYFGFVNGGVLPVGLATSVVSAAWDQNVALPVMSPAGAMLDDAAARLLISALGLSSEAVASFCSGATIANITAVVAARDSLLRRAGWDVHEDGLRGAPPITVVVSDEVHVSALKALRIAGFGQRDVRRVPTDSGGRMIASDLPPLDGPTLVMLQAGNVNTGASDPFDEIADRVDRDETWIHVDGAFGLWAAASPTHRHHVAGVDRADSWATDAHKWLNAPYDCGVVICRDPADLARAMSMDAAYLSVADGERPAMNLGLQMSQAARAVPVFAALASEGREGIARLVDHTCDLAGLFADRLAAAGATILAPRALNQVLVSFGDGPTTEATVERVQQGGVCWMGGTTWQGTPAMRISVSDASTTSADVERSVEAILAAWNETME